MADTTPGFFTLPVSFLGQWRGYKCSAFLFDTDVIICKWRNRLNIRLYVYLQKQKKLLASKT